MRAAEHTLSVEQGALLEQEFEWRQDGVAKLLTGWTAAAQVRAKPGAPDVLLDLTPFLVVQPGGVAGRIRLRAPGSATATLQRGGTWDLLMLHAGTGDRVRLVTGPVELLRATTVVP